jgi:tRNA1(Val) A37 N6-methylase TrmN6
VAGAGVESGLTTVSRLSIVTRHGQQPKRILITMSPRSRASAQFNNCSADAEIDKILYMEDENRNFTDEYRSYVSEFYLKM